MSVVTPPLIGLLSRPPRECSCQMSSPRRCTVAKKAKFGFWFSNNPLVHHCCQPPPPPISQCTAFEPCRLLWPQEPTVRNVPLAAMLRIRGGKVHCAFHSSWSLALFFPFSITEAQMACPPNTCQFGFWFSVTFLPPSRQDD